MAIREVRVVAGAVVVALVLSAQAFAQPGPAEPGKSRSGYTIDPNTPLKELLPAAPKAAPGGPVATDDLKQVPEVEFQAKPEKVTAEQSHKDNTQQIAKINFMNAKGRDAFMAALLESRDDLRGLPFAMGDDCRTAAERARQFMLAAQLVQDTRFGRVRAGAKATEAEKAAKFWEEFEKACLGKDKEEFQRGMPLSEDAVVARAAAVVQIFAAEPPEWRAGLVKYLSTVPHPEATSALSRLAVFSAEDEVRLAALDALRQRLPEEYPEALVKGLRYPWPAVARRSADTIARLGRTDLVPVLVATLAEPDPRLPVTTEVGGKKVTTVRELVKVNHHRNCVMCHAPAEGEKPPKDVLTGTVPLMGRRLPEPVVYYQEKSLGLTVRVDVTYLRQDFSLMMSVADAKPWPEMQRFDFLVRERVVTAEEAATYREKLTPKEGAVSPYHEAAAAALRNLTGKDAEPTAEAWRKVLGKK